MKAKDLSLVYLINTQVQRFWIELKDNKHFRPLTCKNSSLENTVISNYVIAALNNTLIPHFFDPLGSPQRMTGFSPPSDQGGL